MSREKFGPFMIYCKKGRQIWGGESWALHMAAANGHLDIVEYLISRRVAWDMAVRDALNSLQVSNAPSQPADQILKLVELEVVIVFIRWEFFVAGNLVPYANFLPYNIYEYGWSPNSENFSMTFFYYWDFPNWILFKLNDFLKQNSKQVKTRKLCESRNSWHSGWWGFKFVLLIVSMALPFFFPSEFVQIYGEIARIGAGIFLLLQLVSVIHFITSWNKYWTPDEEIKQSCSLGLFISTLFYMASICGVILMYTSNASRSSCSLNIFFITWTALLLAVMIIVSLHPKVNRGLLSSGIMASYIVFLCWCAIRSEPATIRCSTNQRTENGDWIAILGFLIAVFAIVMATFSTGIDSKCFQFRKDEVEQEDDIPYKYGFFHMVFSLGAMYFAMLFISWDLNNSAGKWSIDVGWASTWVKIINEWFAVTFYLWMLISPVVRQNKVMDNEASVQQTTDSVIA